MATTYCFARGARYSAAQLDDLILHYMEPGDFESDMAEQAFFERFKDCVIEGVNNLLPPDMSWLPELSEVWAEVDVDHDDIDNFEDYFKGIFEEAWDQAERETA